MKRLTPYLIIGFFTFCMFSSPKGLSAAPYYQGKVLKIVVGFKPGGGYDRMARIMAKHLPKYIPGKPSVLVENIEGAGSIIAANQVYSLAKPNGLTLGTFNRALLFAQLVKLEGVKYDMTKFSWVGSTAVEGTVLTIRSDLPYKTFDDLRKVKEPIPLGTSGAGTVDYQFPTLLKEFLGLNIKLIIYPSSADSMLAVERKEVDGRAGSYSSLKPFIDRGLVRPVIRGRVAEKGMEQLPVNEDLTTDKRAKAIFVMFSAADLIGRPFVAPPGTPAEVMKILREGFAKAAKDPELQEDAKKNNMEVEYTSHEEILKVINFAFSQPEDIVNEFGKYIKF